jgi:hypothetical protein
VLKVFLLTAACVTGAADPPGTPGCNCNKPAANQPGVVYYEAAANSGGFRQRLRNFFGWQQPQPQPFASPYAVVGAPQAQAPGAIAQTAPPPLAAPQGAAEEQEPAPKQPAQPVAEEDQDKVGHDADYTWITGRLSFVRSDGGRWVLRYGALDEVDRFGGSVVLAPTVEMRNFREGDLVCVHGQVLEQRAARLGGAVYRVTNINMVERSDP